MGLLNATLEQVKAVVPPAKTDTWNPIPHSDFLEIIESELRDQGWRLYGVQHDLGKEGLRYVGRGLLVPADTVDLVREGDDAQLLLGWANFLDKSKGATILGGTDVFICSNGQMFAEHQVSGKHTRNVETTLRSRFQGALDNILNRFDDEVKRFETFKDTVLPRADMAEMVIDARSRGALPAADILKVMGEYDAPKFREFEGGTVWTGFNAFTTVARKRFEKNPAAAADESLALGKLFDERFPVGCLAN